MKPPGRVAASNQIERLNWLAENLYRDDDELNRQETAEQWAVLQAEGQVLQKISFRRE